VQEETLLFDGFVFSFGIQGRGRVGSVKRVGYEGRHGTQHECGEVEDAGGEHVGFASREKRGEGVDAEVVLQGVRPPLIQLELLLLVRNGFHGRDAVGRVRRGFRGRLFRCLRGPCQHLDYLLERRRVGLDERCRVRAPGFGSSHGFGRWQPLPWFLILLLSWGYGMIGIHG